MSDTLDNHGRDDIAIAAGLLRSARNFFEFSEGVVDKLKYKTAAENLQRYRAGNGEARNYTDEEIAAHPALLDTEDKIARCLRERYLPAARPIRR